MWLALNFYWTVLRGRKMSGERLPNRRSGPMCPSRSWLLKKNLVLHQKTKTDKQNTQNKQSNKISTGKSFLIQYKKQPKIQ